MDRTAVVEGNVQLPEETPLLNGYLITSGQADDDACSCRTDLTTVTASNVCVPVSVILENLFSINQRIILICCSLVVHLVSSQRGKEPVADSP